MQNYYSRTQIPLQLQDATSVLLPVYFESPDDNIYTPKETNEDKKFSIDDFLSKMDVATMGVGIGLDATAIGAAVTGVGLPIAGLSKVASLVVTGVGGIIDAALVYRAYKSFNLAAQNNDEEGKVDAIVSAALNIMELGAVAVPESKISMKYLFKSKAFFNLARKLARNLALGLSKISMKDAQKVFESAAKNLARELLVGIEKGAYTASELKTPLKRNGGFIQKKMKYYVKKHELGYVVLPNDNGTSIALHFGIPWNLLFELNKSQFPTEDSWKRILPGQRIILKKDWYDGIPIIGGFINKLFGSDATWQKELAKLLNPELKKEPLRDPDFSIRDLITALENWGKVGYESSKHRWKDSGEGFDPFNRGFGIDIQANPYIQYGDLIDINGNALDLDAIRNMSRKASTSHIYMTEEAANRLFDESINELAIGGTKKLRDTITKNYGLIKPNPYVDLILQALTYLFSDNKIYHGSEWLYKNKEFRDYVINGDYLGLAKYVVNYYKTHKAKGGKDLTDRARRTDKFFEQHIPGYTSVLSHKYGGSIYKNTTHLYYYEVGEFQYYNKK